MWHKLFAKTRRFVEVTGPSNQKKVMSQEEYIERVIKENRIRSQLIRHGIFIPMETNHVMNRSRVD